METIRLSSRLLAIAELVPQGSSVADVGTDHGYIPVWLKQNGFDRVTATDIGSGPLERAVSTAESFGLAAEIAFSLCDGLSGIDPSDAETIIIAGMGGETIAGILSRAPWTREGRALLLQPMSKSELLRTWLLQNGYVIKAECLVRDSGKLYSIITATGGTGAEPEPWEYILSPALAKSGDLLLPEYLDSQLEKLEKRITGLQRSAKQADAERMAVDRALYKKLAEIRREL